MHSNRRDVHLATVDCDGAGGFRGGVSIYLMRVDTATTCRKVLADFAFCVEAEAPQLSHLLHLLSLTHPHLTVLTVTMSCELATDPLHRGKLPAGISAPVVQAVLVQLVG
jgi:hypothetical protein